MKSVIDSLGLSLQEFLAILIPGVSMCYFLTFTPLMEHKVLFCMTDLLSGVFLFTCSYFAGYVLYVAGSYLDHFYDWIKLKALKLTDLNKHTDENLKYIDPNNRLSFMYNMLFPYLTDTHNLIVKVASLKSKDVGFELSGTQYNLMNAYQYAFRRLMTKAPMLFDEVQRYYATAKFFRSMTLVLFIGFFIILFFDSQNYMLIWLLISSIISFFVFLNRWRMANHVAYKNLIVLEERK